MRFEKWDALGNDYAIFEAEVLPWELTPARVQAICALHSGVGSDGVLLLSRAEEDEIVADLRIFNPDGSEAELSGNGAREAAMYLRRSGWTNEDEFAMRTKAGIVRPAISGRECTMEMGRAATASDDFPGGPADGRAELKAGDRDWPFQHVSIGNPQCAIRIAALEDLEALELAAIGPDIESNVLFPNRTNVSFFLVDGDRVRARIFERGVGETMSSGTGAGGAAVAAYLAGAQSPITVELDGGELTVEISPDLDVKLTGWAEPVYGGELSAELIERLAELH
jgi:diaminopimelate epimerase